MEQQGKQTGQDYMKGILNERLKGCKEYTSLHFPGHNFKIITVLRTVFPFGGVEEEVKPPADRPSLQLGTSLWRHGVHAGRETWSCFR